MMNKPLIAISGASGFIGQQLCKYFAGKYKIILISRTANHKHNIYSWDDICKLPEILNTTACVINLAGANIGDKRWSSRRKDIILNSRLDTTAKLIQILNKLDSRPDFLCASAVGVYPTNGVYDEYSKLNYNQYNSFSEMVTKQWERVTQNYYGRVVNMRFGVVTSSYGGALNKILLPFKFGVACGIQDSNWGFSWISSVDLCNAIDYLIEHKDISGPINLVAPQIITYSQLIGTISGVYEGKLRLNLPRWVIKLLFGEMGQELLLSGQRVRPQKLIEHNFHFKYPNIESCINAVKQGLT